MKPLAALALAVLLLTDIASAQTIYRWTNSAGGSWTDAANWLPTGPANGADNIADFSGLDLLADVTVTLDASRTIGQLRFGDTTPSHNWTLSPGSGGTLTIDVASGSPQIAVSNQTATVAAALAGSKGLVKTGTGTLVLSGNNTYTGNTTNFAGTIVLRGATGHLADSSGLTFGGGSTFIFDNIGASGAISETMGSLLFIAGEATIKSVRTEAQTMTLVTAYNTHLMGSSGNFFVIGGVNGTENKIVLSGRGSGLISGRHAFHGTNYGWYDSAGYVRGINYGVDSSTVIVPAGATLGAQSSKHVKLTGAITAQTNLTVATLNITGPYDFTLGPGTTFTFGNGLMKSGGGTSTFSGGVLISNLNNEFPVRVDQPDEMLIFNSRIGNFALTKCGAGTLILGNTPNDFTNTFVDNGTLKLGTPNAIPAIAGRAGVTVLDAGILDLAGFDNTINGLTGNGTVDNSGTNAVLTIGANDIASAFSGQIRNTGGSLSVRKIGGNTFTLNGSNVFSGDLVVSNGTLALGAFASVRSASNLVVGGGALDLSAVSGGFRLASGQTLRGSGNVIGAVTVSPSATLFPNSLGRLAFSSSLALQGETRLRLSKSGSVLTNDVVAVTGNLNLGGLLKLTLEGDALAPGDAFKLFTAGSYSNAFASLDLPSPGTGLAWNTDTLSADGTVRVVSLSTVPVISVEPSDTQAEACSNATITAVASGAAPLAYQWFRNGSAISGGTNQVLLLANASSASAGVYQLIVTNDYGSATSRLAAVAVVDTRPPVISGTAGVQTIMLNSVQTVTPNSNGVATVPSLTAAITVSDCNSVTVTQSPPAGAILLVDSTNVTLFARDASNNLATTTFPILVVRPYGPAANVPESASYTLLASLTIPSSAAYNTSGVTYDIDHRRWLTNFSRIGYYLEVQPTNGSVQYVWVSMDAFSPSADQVCVPTVQSGAVLSNSLANVDIRSSVAGVPTGSSLSGASFRFYPGDASAPSSAGRGTMQVWVGTNVVFAFNGWGNGAIDLGIGNNPAGAPDWTGAANAGSYSIKRLLVYVLPAANPSPVDYDVVVYGGTSGGVAAAVQAARMGKRTVLLSYDNHLGGLTSGGLGATDTGNINSIGGVSREFYRRIGQRYGMTERFNFEPRVAEQTFAAMLAEAGVQVFFNQRLQSVTKTNARIASVTMTDSSVYRAKMFIDTTYEGDLMAQAGVSFTIGRESTNTYGENLNGIRPTTPAHQFVLNIDPYNTPGDAGSGLLPYIQPGDGGTPGDGDTRVQAYNFRLCLTQTAANRMAIAPPSNYDPAKYELLARYIQARVAAGHSLTVGTFMNPVAMPNGKTDVNNNGAFSTDFIGMNYDYPATNYAGRAALWKAHEDYIRGFLVFLGTDSRVPSSLRNSMLSYGLSIDEFLDTGGWPHAMYVREGRRMVSDYVITQDDCAWRRVAADSIGLASYNMDSHNCQRVVQGGYVRNEGDVQQAPAGPFPIAYRAIVPKSSECENLFVTFALSGSHIAFSSCRMEPVFMITSQSAATAAAFAIDDNVPVQEVNYAKLALQLQADAQILRWSTAVSTDGSVIVDNSDTGFVTSVGSWVSSASTPGYWGGDYLHDNNDTKGGKSFTFTPVLPSNGVYEVYLRWTEHTNRAPSVPIDIIHPAGTNTVFVNQQINGGVWMKLLTTNFNAGTNARVVIRNDGTTGYVVADAVRFYLPGSAAPLPVAQVIATRARTGETNALAGLFTFARSGDTNTQFVVNYAVSGSASNGVDYASVSGSVTFGIGVTSVALPVSAVNDGFAEGEEAVTVTLLPGSGYTVGALSNATVAIEDGPVVNHAPVAGAVSILTRQDRTFALPLSVLLAACSDPDGDALTIAGASTTSTNGGTVSLTATNVLYTPVAGYSGADRFAYVVSDGQTIAAGVVNVVVLSTAQVTPSFSPLVAAGQGVTLVFGGAPGYGYEVQRAPAVTGPWTVLTNIVCGQSGTMTVQDTNAAAAFYRIAAP